MARPTDVDKDQQLLNILKANARTPLTEIAKALGVSRATVQARIARLERDRVIAGYTLMAGADPEPATTLAAIVLVELEARQQAHVVTVLKTRPEIAACYTVNGAFDLFVRIQCRTAAHLDAAIDWIGGIDGVHRTMTSILLARKFER